MAGIFDFMNDPEAVGLLSASAAMFDRSNNTPQRMGLGQIITGGLLGGMQGYQGAMDGQQKREMQKQQLAMAKLKEAREQSQFDMQQNLIKEYMGGGGQSQPSMPAAMPGQLGSGMYGDIAPPDGMPAIPQMPAQQASGQSPESARLNKLRAMAVAGVPGAKELFDIHKYENDPMKYEAGSMYKSRIDGSERIIPKLAEGATAVNGVYQNMPGYTDALAQVETAKATASERAKAGLDPLPLGYVDPEGRPVGGTRLNYVQGDQQPSAGASSPQKYQGVDRRASVQNSGFPAGTVVPKLAPTSGTFAPGKSDTLALLEQNLAEETDPINRAALQREIARAGGGQSQNTQAGGRPVLQSQAEKQAIEDEAKIKLEGTLGQQKVTAAVDQAKQLEAQSSTKKASQLYQQLGAALPQARELLKNATGSGLGAMADKSMGFFGRATDSGVAADQLETLGGWMTANVPRMEGPQSDKDVASYKQMAGMVGDRSKPAASRLAALNTLEELQNKYAAINGAASAPQSNSAANKSVSLADISATAKASGRSTAEVTAALKAKGYKIGGM